MKTRILGLTALQMMTVCITALLITACTPPLPPQPAPEPSDPPPRREQRDPERYSDRRTGECGRDRKCEEICDDIFRSRKDREDCEEYSISDVEDMEEVFEILEDPNGDDLDDLDLQALDMMLDISSDPLETAVSRMSATEKKKFLVWLAENSEATQLIESAEDDFNILEELFGTSQTSVITELNKNIDSGDTFVEIILDEGNEEALEWLHDFFGHKCDNNNNYERCVFENYYCDLSLHQDAEDEYFDYEFFEDLLDEILANERKPNNANPPSWWDSSTESGELDSWQSSPHNVCSNMKT